MTRYKVWDPAVRLFHWALVAGFAANALFIDDESRLHQWIGYAVLGLVLFRLVWGFVGSPHARFADFPPDPGAAVEEAAAPVGQRPFHRVIFRGAAIGSGSSAKGRKNMPDVGSSAVATPTMVMPKPCPTMDSSAPRPTSKRRIDGAGQRPAWRRTI